MKGFDISLNKDVYSAGEIVKGMLDLVADERIKLQNFTFLFMERK